ncbi:MAG: hypothetical protein CL398_08570 [Acidiferrobacteraceae bacterium]|nr:hypothetical protein [Acidiferrobacteraceae bacterium]|tara:strand:+ start:253 stop:435 length:183 start_codon:yes stop_codon:yes gene_type:complete
MPKNIKIVVSIITILVALITYYVEHYLGNEFMKWFVLSLGIFMALSLWLFPEPKKLKSLD